MLLLFNPRYNMVTKNLKRNIFLTNNFKENFNFGLSFTLKNRNVV